MVRITSPSNANSNVYGLYFVNTALLYGLFVDRLQVSDNEIATDDDKRNFDVHKHRRIQRVINLIITQYEVNNMLII